MTKIPYGYCHCGCGQKTNLAPQTQSRDGWVKGEPLKYLRGHVMRRRPFSPEHRARLSESMSGERHWNWQGGRKTDRHGYVHIKVEASDPLAIMRDSQGYVPEHRLVVARALGRPLTPSEHVHHIDQERSHNALENLVPLQGVANHNRIHRLQRQFEVEWDMIVKLLRRRRRKALSPVPDVGAGPMPKELS